MLNRRSLISGFAALLAAPAVVRAASLMPIGTYAERDDLLLWATGYCEVQLKGSRATLQIPIREAMLSASRYANVWALSSTKRKPRLGKTWPGSDNGTWMRSAYGIDHTHPAPPQWLNDDSLLLASAKRSTP